MEKQNRGPKATREQILRINTMLGDRRIDKAAAQEIIEEYSEVPRFRVPIVNIQPEFEELELRFPAFVHPDFGGRRFVPIERCMFVRMDKPEVAFGYIHLDRDASTDEVLTEMDRRGLRPAFYEELLSFAEKYPDEQRKFPIVALGSETDVLDNRRVAFLWNDYRGRTLGLRRIVVDWGGNFRFLFVRK